MLVLKLVGPANPQTTGVRPILLGQHGVVGAGEAERHPRAGNAQVGGRLVEVSVHRVDRLADGGGHTRAGVDRAPTDVVGCGDGTPDRRQGQRAGQSDADVADALVGARLALGAAGVGGVGVVRAAAPTAPAADVEPGAATAAAASPVEAAPGSTTGSAPVRALRPAIAARAGPAISSVAIARSRASSGAARAPAPARHTAAPAAAARRAAVGSAVPSATRVWTHRHFLRSRPDRETRRRSRWSRG